MTTSSCELCDSIGGDLLYEGGNYRVIGVTGLEGAVYVGYCRVVWNSHVKELTDLSAAGRNVFMEAVYRLESALRVSLAPDKMNVASLGNLTPHLHWHVIPRFIGDAAYPKPVWAQVLPATTAGSVDTLREKRWRDAVQEAFREKDATQSIN